MRRPKLAVEVGGAATRRRGPADSVFVAVVGVVVAIVYLLTLSGNHSENEDSVNFAVRVRDDPHSQFFEGTHVIFDWVAWLVYELVRTLGITRDPLRTIQVFDALLASVTVAILLRTLRRAAVPIGASLLSSAVFAFSYGFWRNSVEVEVYTLSAFALVISFATVLRAMERPDARAFVAVGFANGFAVLAHVTNVLFAGVVLAATVLAGRRRSCEGAARWFVAYAGAGCLVVVPVYATAAIVLKLGSPGKFWDWFTAETGGGSYGQVTVGAVKDAVIGCARALVGAHSALALHPIWSFVEDHFPGKPLREEAFFLRGFSTTLAVVLLVMTAAVGILMLALVGLWLARRPPRVAAAREIGVLCVVWLVAYAILFTFWDPLNIELWYVFWLPAAVLISLPLAVLRPPRWRMGLGICFVLGLFVVNLLGSQLPQRANAKDYWRVRAAWYRTHVGRGDLLITYDYIWSSYLQYLTHAHVVDAQALFKRMPRRAAAERIRRIADFSAARRVFISGYAFHPFPGNPAACNDGLGTCANAAALRRLLLPHARLVARTQLESVWRYEPAR